VLYGRYTDTSGQPNCQPRCPSAVTAASGFIQDNGVSGLLHGQPIAEHISLTASHISVFSTTPGLSCKEVRAILLHACDCHMPLDHHHQVVCAPAVAVPSALCCCAQIQKRRGNSSSFGGSSIDNRELGLHSDQNISTDIPPAGVCAAQPVTCNLLLVPTQFDDVVNCAALRVILGCCWCFPALRICCQQVQRLNQSVLTVCNPARTVSWTCQVISHAMYQTCFLRIIFCV
jgi:hypothetical protein